MFARHVLLLSAVSIWLNTVQLATQYYLPFPVPHKVSHFYRDKFLRGSEGEFFAGSNGRRNLPLLGPQPLPPSNIFFTSSERRMIPAKSQPPLCTLYNPQTLSVNLLMFVSYTFSNGGSRAYHFSFPLSWFRS